jgi:hypothetical protein
MTFYDLKLFLYRAVIKSASTQPIDDSPKSIIEYKKIPINKIKQHQRQQHLLSPASNRIKSCYFEVFLLWEHEPNLDTYILHKPFKQTITVCKGVCF